MVFQHHLHPRQIHAILDSQNQEINEVCRLLCNIQTIQLNQCLTLGRRDEYSTSDSDSDSKWKTEDVMQSLEDDSYDGSESEETDFRSKEKADMLNRINYRWVEWVSVNIN